MIYEVRSNKTFLALRYDAEAAKQTAKDFMNRWHEVEVWELEHDPRHNHSRLPQALFQA